MGFHEHGTSGHDFNIDGIMNVICTNVIRSNYTYDPNTYRLMRLQTLQTGSPDFLQDLNYTYDPIGNITNLTDDAQQTIFFRNQRVEPSNDYIYDVIYRLIQATGREHLGQTNNSPNKPTPPAAFDSFHTRLDHPGDGNAMGTYVESYDYDSVGNIQTIHHVGSQPASAGWTRKYSYQEPSQLVPFSSGIMGNRLSSTTIRSTTEVYKYAGNAGMHGLMTSMPQLTGMQWNSFDQLQSTTRQKMNGSSVPETTYYIYDSLGQRIRKVTERQANDEGTATRMKESIYIGIFEVHRKYTGDGTTVSLERETIHIMDDRRRVAMVQTRTRGEDGSPQRLIRYQYSNHIESACLELDDTARIISYEEYYPYGSTSYQATSNITQVPKRYRYIGKERDKESGLDYHGRRYYASWIGRWISADPGGIIDGLNLYWYGHDNPIVMTDPSGFAAQDEKVDVLVRGNYTENMSQKDVKLAYGNIGVWYTGDATWNKKYKSWTVDRSQLISSQEAGAMTNYWGGAHPAATTPAETPPPPSQEGSGGPGGAKPGADKEPGVAESFAYGLAKGFVIGVATGLVFGAIIASGGTLAVLATGIGYGMPSSAPCKLVKLLWARTSKETTYQQTNVLRWPARSLGDW
jgi:RHS repeat-associated protein